MNVLVTGAAGYIGSHILKIFTAAGHNCVGYDNLSKGHREAVGTCKLIEADLEDTASLKAALVDNDIELVIHMAAFIEAGESVELPAKYFWNNSVNALRLLETMAEVGVQKLVFSSTAAVYGNPENIPIVETDRTQPINPYGASKLCTEFMIRAFAESNDMGFAVLRYFNVAGASPDGEIGEDHSPETHLVPLVLQVAGGKREKIFIFGDDYDTHDGTCVRDYIHVCDLAEAHRLAAGVIEPGQVKVFNLGNGEGFTVREIIETCREVTGHAIPAELAPRRPGDPDKLIASSAKAIDALGWQPKYPSVKEIVSHAWQWHKSRPSGYDD